MDTVEPSLMALQDSRNERGGDLSHFVSLVSPQMSTPTALRGPCSWGDKVGVPAANGATNLVASCWLTPKIMGHVASFWQW